MGDPNEQSVENPDQQAVDEALAEEVKTAAASFDAAAADHNAADDLERADQSESDSMADLKSQLHESQQRALRIQADLENFRKRSRRELDEGLKYAATPLIRDLLPVLDNLQRAIAAESEAAGSGAGLVQGVQMVADQLTMTLAQHHCKVIEAEGQPFDPMLHEALLQQPSDEHPSGTVIQVAQTGYQLHDRVIRPAHVIVSQGPANTEG